MRVENTLFKIFLFDRNSFKFTLGVMLGLSFSISVILSTVGLMDGFVYGLKAALKNSQGDILVQSRSGFFNYDSALSEELDILGIPKDQRTAMIHTEGFLLHGGQTRGVLIRGVEPASFSRVAGIELGDRLVQRENELARVAIGERLAQDFNLNRGDEITLTFAQGSRNVRGLPLMKRLTVSSIVEHNIHQHDERFIYMDVGSLQTILDIGERYNLLSFNIEHGDVSLEHRPIKYTRAVEEEFPRVRQRLSWNYVVRPFWHDFSSLIEAVEVQKGMISLILQIIVVISVFNVVALIIYFNEKKARQIFLFQALGMSRKRLSRAWLLFALLIWLCSSVVSLFFVAFFSWCLKHVTFLHLPSDVYHLGTLGMRLGPTNYALVFGATLLWILAVAWFSFFRMRKKSLLAGLREEFS